MSDPADYPDYFCSNDSLLNRIWYAGAYTAQLNAISPAQGREWPPPSSGGENIEANALLYKALTGAAALARAEGNSSLAGSYASQAASLKTQVNARLWDSSAGAYKDNPTSTLYPQDGNSLAVWYGLASPAQAQGIVSYLKTDWNAIGAQTPEFSGNISPFAGSMEV